MPPLVAPPDDLLLPLVAAEARDAGVEANAAVGSAGADYWSGRAERRTRTLCALSFALRALLLSAGLCAAAYALMRGLRSPSRSPPARQIRGAEAADRQGATFEGHLATVSRRLGLPSLRGQPRTQVPVRVEATCVASGSPRVCAMLACSACRLPRGDGPKPKVVFASSAAAARFQRGRMAQLERCSSHLDKTYVHIHPL